MLFTEFKIKKSKPSLREMEMFLKEQCTSEKYYYPGKYDHEMGAEYSSLSPYPPPTKQDPVDWEDFFDHYGFVPLLEFGHVPLDLTFYYLDNPRLSTGSHLAGKSPGPRESMKYARIIFEHVTKIRSGSIVHLDMMIQDMTLQTMHDLAWDIIVPTVKSIPYDKGHTKIVQQFHCD